MPQLTNMTNGNASAVKSLEKILNIPRSSDKNVLKYQSPSQKKKNLNVLFIDGALSYINWSIITIKLIIPKNTR